MRKSIYSIALAAIVTGIDLAVFIHSLPIICAAWGTNRVVMALVSVAMFIWADSLANLWKAARQPLRAEAQTDLPVDELMRVRAAAREGDRRKLALLGGGLLVAVLFFVFTAVVGHLPARKPSNSCKGARPAPRRSAGGTISASTARAS